MICWRCKFNKECDGLKIRSCKDFLPRTNGDRLREMTDEELAAFLTDIEVKANKYGYEAADGAPDEYPLPEDWLAWLKQEVDA